MFFAIHTTLPTQTLVPMLRTTLSIRSNLPLGTVRTLDEIVTRSTASRRFTVVLLTAFAGIALILALVGIFGVTSYSVSRQIPRSACASRSAPRPAACCASLSSRA